MNGFRSRLAVVTTIRQRIRLLLTSPEPPSSLDGSGTYKTIDVMGLG